MLGNVAKAMNAVQSSSGGTISVPSMPKVTIPRFASGGFPEDGLFFANSTELVGRFANGKTAIANNEQIVDGIRGGVEQANEEQNQLLREQNNLLRRLLEKESNVVFPISPESGKAVTRAQRMYDSMRGTT